MYLNDEEKKIIFFILSRNCWACNDLIQEGKYHTFQYLRATCPRLDCDKMKLIYELVHTSGHTTFKDFMGFDYPENMEGWRNFFSYRKGWAS